MLTGAVVGGGREEVDVFAGAPEDPPLVPLLAGAMVLVMSWVEVTVDSTRLLPRTTVVNTEVMTVMDGVAEAVLFPPPDVWLPEADPVWLGWALLPELVCAGEPVLPLAAPVED